MTAKLLIDQHGQEATFEASARVGALFPLQLPTQKNIYRCSPWVHR